MDRSAKNGCAHQQIDHKVDKISGKGRNRTEYYQLRGRSGGSHQYFHRPGLLGFLHGAEKGLRAHHEEGVDAGADQEKREIFHAVRTETGTDRTGQVIEGCQFHQQTDSGDHEAAAVAGGGQQIAAHESPRTTGCTIGATMT